MTRAFSFSWLLFNFACLASGAADLPTPDAVVNARDDLWGEAALRQPDGPSYEFFAPLLPPPRYVNADFKYYPIVLSAPSSPVKARIISNGSGVNTPGNTRSWRDPGTSVTFRVGPDELRFGEYPGRLDGPHLEEGWLPIVDISYTHGDAVFTQESFAATDPELASNGIVFVRFQLAKGTNGMVAVQLEDRATPLKGKAALANATGKILLWHEGGWNWTRQRLVGRLSPGKSLTVAIATKPAEPMIPSPLPKGGYEAHKMACREAASQVATQGTVLESPEPVVNHAWKALLISTHNLIHTNRMFYSAGNQYAQLYESEGCDAIEGLLAWGHTNDVKRLIPAQLSFARKGLEFHQAGHKLLLLANYHHLTKDTAFVASMREHWQRELRLIIDGRTEPNRLFPRERYCGDIPTPVYSLNSNAKCWRALHEFIPLLREMGEARLTDQTARVAGQFREAILKAARKSIRSDVEPPFVPIALSGEEEPPLPVTATRIGSYWNLMAGYVIGTGVFGVNSREEGWLIDYQRRNGGLCMGLIRCHPENTFWTGPHSINPLYGLRHTLAVLRRDEPDQALVSFYGMLAQGFTRETFVGSEGCSLAPLDAGGRLFYCPPNSAANGFFLQMLRNLLVQDWDMDDDGSPETLRLLFATPRRWMHDGKEIVFNHAPTAFGVVSLRAISKLSAGNVAVAVTPPAIPPKRMLLRARIPDGWSATGASIEGRKLEVDREGTVDVSTEHKPFTIVFQTQRHP